MPDSKIPYVQFSNLDNSGVRIEGRRSYIYWLSICLIKLLIELKRCTLLH